MEDEIIQTQKRTRTEELKRIAKERRVIFDISSLLQKNNILESEELITTKQFIFIAVLHQLNIPYIRTLLELIIDHGPICSIIGVLVGMLVVGLPLFMLYTFMGHYSKRGYMRVWECVPMLKGLGYAVAVVMIMSEIYNIAVAALSLEFISDIVKNPLPWLECPPGVPSCVERTSKYNACEEVEIQQYFPVQTFLRQKLLMNKWEWKLNMKIYGYAFFLWLVVFWCSYQGFQRFGNITIKLCFSVFILIIILGVIVLGGYRKSGIYGYKLTTQVSFDVKMIGTIVTLSCIANEPGTIIFLSAIAPSHINTSVISAGIFAIKIFFTILIVIFFIVIIETTHVRYAITSTKCISMNTHDILFAFVLDVLTDLPVNRLWMVCTMMIYAYVGFLSVLYTVTATLESLMEIVPKRIRRRSFIALLICGFGCGWNIYCFIPYGVLIDSIAHTLCLRICSMFILLAATSAIIFLYPISILVTDVFFLYGSPPHAYWITAWTICPMALMFGAFVVIFHTGFSVELNKIKSYFLKAIPFAGYIFVTIPIILVGFCVYVNFVKSEKTTTLFKPDKSWGPKGSAKILSRAQFRPDRDLKYRNPILKCKHKCSLNSHNYTMEKLNQSLKYKRFVEELKKSNL